MMERIRIRLISETQTARAHETQFLRKAQYELNLISMICLIFQQRTDSH
jgi:hypothetical protein